MTPVMFVSMVRGVKMDDELQGMQTVTMVYCSASLCKERQKNMQYFRWETCRKETTWKI
jgi:hypothetical protein